MTVLLRIVLIAISVLTALYVLRRIRKSQMQIGDSIFWLIFIAVVLVFSIFPSVPEFFAELIGVQATYNFLYLFFIFILLYKTFTLSIKVSMMDHKITQLTEEVAIRENQIEEMKKEMKKEVGKNS